MNAFILIATTLSEGLCGNYGVTEEAYYILPELNENFRSIAKYQLISIYTEDDCVEFYNKEDTENNIVLFVEAFPGFFIIRAFVKTQDGKRDVSSYKYNYRPQIDPEDHNYKSAIEDISERILVLAGKARRNLNVFYAFYTFFENDFLYDLMVWHNIKYKKEFKTHLGDDISVEFYPYDQNKLYTKRNLLSNKSFTLSLNLNINGTDHIFFVRRLRFFSLSKDFKKMLTYYLDYSLELFKTKYSVQNLGKNIFTVLLVLEKYKAYDRKTLESCLSYDDSKILRSALDCIFQNITYDQLTMILQKATYQELVDLFNNFSNIKNVCYDLQGGVDGTICDNTLLKNNLNQYSFEKITRTMLFVLKQIFNTENNVEFILNIFMIISKDYKSFVRIFQNDLAIDEDVKTCREYLFKSSVEFWECWLFVFANWTNAVPIEMDLEIPSFSCILQEIAGLSLNINKRTKFQIPSYIKNLYDYEDLFGDYFLTSEIN
ncbi:hypothetical protein NGRA_0554 [Nosema granulosis]|uniref:Uncharacterized protein n=1 Tax=Nosema granulosis TaxID=83296 RepID=A0A9P6H157_9MICR|nr:hypothetical protein NGRA_0554 [Nosema granulosis]